MEVIFCVFNKLIYPKCCNNHIRQTRKRDEKKYINCRHFTTLLIYSAKWNGKEMLYTLLKRKKKDKKWFYLVIKFNRWQLMNSNGMCHAMGSIMRNNKNKHGQEMTQKKNLEIIHILCDNKFSCWFYVETYSEILSIHFCCCYSFNGNKPVNERQKLVNMHDLAEPNEWITFICGSLKRSTIYWRDLVVVMAIYLFNTLWNYALHSM